MENHLRQMRRIKLRPGADSAAAVGHRHRLEFRECRPDLGVLAQVLRPADRQIRRGRRRQVVDRRVFFFQPVDDDLVGIVVFAFGVIDQRTVGQGGGAIERLAHVRTVKNNRGQQLVVAILGRLLAGPELLAQLGLDGCRFGHHFNVDNVGTQKLVHAGAAALLQGPEVFDKDPAFQIVGVQRGLAVAVVEPQRARLGRRRRAGIGVVAHRHKLVRHVAGHESVVNRIHRHNVAGGDFHDRRGEGFLGPVNRPRRLGSGRGHRKHLGPELVRRRGFAAGAGVRHARNPRHRHPPWLGGKHFLGVRAVVISLRRAEGFGGGRADRRVGRAGQGDRQTIDHIDLRTQ